jgi:hypothetical protein
VRPSPGRIVHYVPDEHATVLLDRCHAAIVTGASLTDPESILLTVFPPGAFVLALHRPCPHDEEAKAPGTWHWPERVSE